MKPSGLYLIGLTGGIACGKSAVLAMLTDLGAHAIDADEVTRRLQEPGNEVYTQIVATFGPEVVQHPGGPLDRAALGARVFGNPAELARLEQIVHPAVQRKVFAWLGTVAAQHDEATRAADKPVAVLDAIKLLEGGWKAHCDAVWVVQCTPAQQVERLIQTRGMSEQVARQRIAAQPSQESRFAQADVIIDNSGTLEHTRQQVQAAWHSLKTVQ
jgi:dephospho-CoA kinase